MTVPALFSQLVTPLDHALLWARQGQAVAIATVTGTWGSSPRPPGSNMVISKNGLMEGSVSGGCVETDVMLHAQEIMEGHAPTVISYGVSSAKAWEVGLACGGKLDVMVEAIQSPACPTGTWPLHLLEQICDLQAARKAAVLVRSLDGKRHVLVQDQQKNISEGLPSAVLEAASLQLQDGRCTTVEEADGQKWFVQPILPPPRLFIVGAVHIAQYLARIAQITGFSPIVIDPREALATPDRFPGLESGSTLITEWPDEALEALGVDSMTAIVTLTHDAKLDDPTLEAALKSPAFYIGALGSRKTQASRLQRLQTLGFTEQNLKRIRGPVGLAIGAVGAEEIALSIMAEIVATRRHAPLADIRGW